MLGTGCHSGPCIPLKLSVSSKQNFMLTEADVDRFHLIEIIDSLSTNTLNQGSYYHPKFPLFSNKLF